jgi:hypothetical protein
MTAFDSAISNFGMADSACVPYCCSPQAARENYIPIRLKVTAAGHEQFRLCVDSAGSAAEHCTAKWRDERNDQFAGRICYLGAAVRIAGGRGDVGIAVDEAVATRKLLRLRHCLRLAAQSCQTIRRRSTLQFVDQLAGGDLRLSVLNGVGTSSHRFFR